MQLCVSLSAGISHFFSCMGCCLMIEIEKCIGRKSCSSFMGLLAAYFGALTQFTMEKLRNKCKNFCKSRGCFGCFSKHQVSIPVDEPSKGLKVRGREVKKPSVSEDFWSTSACDMDNSAVQSQQSISSIGTSNLNVDPHSSAGSSNNPSEFVNHGLLLWNQIRQQWVGNRKTQKPKSREPKLSWNATYESLLGTNKPFAEPIPLPEMVDFLVDVWEQEGLYD